MAKVTVSDGLGGTLEVEEPNENGRTDAAASRPVALSTEDFTAVTSIATKLDTSIARLETIISHVDGLEGFTDGLESALGAINTLITATNGYVDGLEAAMTSLNNYVDGLEGLNAKANASFPLLASTTGQNPNVVKNSAATLKGIQGQNKAAYDVFLKIYNKSTNGTTSDTPIKTLILPAGMPFAMAFDFALSTGLAFRITKLIGSADATDIAAGDVVALNIDYI